MIALKANILFILVFDKPFLPLSPLYTLKLQKEKTLILIRVNIYTGISGYFL